MSRATKIALVAWKMWAREMCRALRVPPSFAAVIGLLTVVAAFFFGCVLASVTVSRLGADLPADLAPIIARASLAGVWITSGLIATIFAVTSPPRTMLHALLDLLPVGRRAAAVGQLAPMVTVATAFCVALSLPTLAVFARIFAGATLVRGVLAVVACIGVTQILCVALFLTLSWMLRRGTRFAGGIADTLAAFVVMAGILATASGDVITADISTSAPLDVLPHRILAAGVVAQLPLATAAMAAGWVVILVVLVLVAVSVRPAASEQRAPLLLRGWAPPHGRMLPMIWFELVTAVRSLSFLTTVTGGVGLVLGATVLLQAPVTADLARALASMAPTVPFALGVYAVGRTLPVTWISAHAAPERNGHAIAVAVAAAVVGIAVSTILVVPLVLTGVLTVTDLPALGARAVQAGALALLAGALIPASQEQSVSTTAAAFLFGVLLLGSSVSLNVAATFWGDTFVPWMALAGAAIACALYMQTCARHPIADRANG